MAKDNKKLIIKLRDILKDVDILKDDNIKYEGFKNNITTQLNEFKNNEKINLDDNNIKSNVDYFFKYPDNYPNDLKEKIKYYKAYCKIIFYNCYLEDTLLFDETILDKLNKVYTSKSKNNILKYKYKYFVLNNSEFDKYKPIYNEIYDKLKDFLNKKKYCNLDFTKPQNDANPPPNNTNPFDDSYNESPNNANQQQYDINLLNPIPNYNEFDKAGNDANLSDTINESFKITMVDYFIVKNFKCNTNDDAECITNFIYNAKIYLKEKNENVSYTAVNTFFKIFLIPETIYINYIIHCKIILYNVVYGKDNLTKIIKLSTESLDNASTIKSYISNFKDKLKTYNPKDKYIFTSNDDQKNINNLIAYLYGSNINMSTDFKTDITNYNNIYNKILKPVTRYNSSSNLQSTTLITPALTPLINQSQLPPAPPSNKKYEFPNLNPFAKTINEFDKSATNTIFKIDDLVKTNPMIINFELKGKMVDLNEKSSFPASVKILNLNNDTFTTDANFGGFPDHLKYLYLDNNKLTNQNIDVMKFDILVNLELLSLTNNKITALFNIPKNLKYLLLDNNKITTFDVDKIIMSDKLEVLSLNNNSITTINIQGTIPIPIPIKEIYLDNNKITNISGLNYLTELNVLSLNTNQLTKIEEIRNLKNLTDLYLDNNQITKINMPISLITLYLNNNKIEVMNNIINNPVSSLSSDKTTTTPPYSLEELYVGKNKLSDPASININLHNFPNLKLLFLNRSEITGITNISEAKLENLFLENNNIKTIDINNISKVNNLYLNGNPIKFENILNYNENVIKIIYNNNTIYKSNDPTLDKTYSDNTVIDNTINPSLEKKNGGKRRTLKKKRKRIIKHKTRKHH
jgi:hypothetical protein